MQLNNIVLKIQRYQKKLNGCTIQYDLSPYSGKIDEIKDLALSLDTLTDARIREKSNDLKARALSGAEPDSLRAEAFALVYAAVKRVLRITPFDVQLIGAIVLDQDKLAEMQTGEGKTLTAVFPAYLNALYGKGVHILTFNDYLARRDAEWMGPVYSFLGLKAAFVREGLTNQERRSAYGADITYCTAKESGFDYLRDGLCFSANQRVHRPFHYAIIDEADSILIDEARNPLIIAGADDAEDNVQTLYRMSDLARNLVNEQDFEYDTYARNIFLTEIGTRKIESLLKCGNLYEDRNFSMLTRIQYALHAQYLLHKDKDYIIRSGKIELVDEFTGRIADKRRWPDGLQAAIEAKEQCAVQTKGRIYNSVPLQHFLQLYPKLSGMTATAQAAEEEFRVFYNLNIVVVPPNRTCIRTDLPDLLFATKKEKVEALLKEISFHHQNGRPVLVGTSSVAESAEIAEQLRFSGLQCEVLNAKRDAFEAKIIAEAGRYEAITISTNMAGRGTDIRLGGIDEKERDRIAGLGGLMVIGTNRHESLRIDNQLRGRAGRQGDPGSSQFFCSLEDDLFKKYRIRDLLPVKFIEKPGRDGKGHPVVMREVNRIQRIIEGQNLEIKKSLVKYSFMIEQQRRILYEKRTIILERDVMYGKFKSEYPAECRELIVKMGENNVMSLCRQITLSHLDHHWSDYLLAIAEIRDGIHLRRLGKQDPLYEFQKLAIEMFDRLLTDFETDAMHSMSSLAGKDSIPESVLKTPSATWTYLVNDDPWEDKFEMKFIGDIGFSFGAALQMPLLLLYFAFKKMLKRKQGQH